VHRGGVWWHKKHYLLQPYFFVIRKNSPLPVAISALHSTFSLIYVTPVVPSLNTMLTINSFSPTLKIWCLDKNNDSVTFSSPILLSVFLLYLHIYLSQISNLQFRLFPTIICPTPRSCSSSFPQFGFYLIVVRVQVFIPWKQTGPLPFIFSFNRLITKILTW